ncbi:MAG: prenyltransferase/squalene oxidase repeat-containing protein, partial [Promethearchaeota archaeon]
ATAYALEILGKYQLLEKKDIFGTVEKTYNSSDLQDELEASLDSMFQTGNIDIYNIYYILKSLAQMDYEIAGTLALQIRSYIDSTGQDDHGFSGSTSSSSSSLISTYFSLQIYDLLDVPIPDAKIFVRSCNKPEDGGFGGDSTSSSTITDTYYALLIMEFYDDFGPMPSEDLTIDYLNNFYVDDENDEDNYGGYLPDQNAEYALLSSTYYCIKGISLINEDEIEDEEATTQWIMNHQNFQDGGFVDDSDGYDQKFSSVINSYYAYESLVLLGSQDLLEEKVFMLEFEWYDWVLFICILCALIALAIIGIAVWRKRRL